MHKNVQHKNKVLWVDHFGACPPKNRLWTTFPKGSDGFLKKKLLNIERLNKREKLRQMASSCVKPL